MRFVRAVPVTFWLTLGLVASVAGASWWHTRAVDAADARGYQRALNNARFDSTMHAMADTARARSEAKTDTVLQTVTQHVTRIRTVTVHDTIRTAFPVVDTLVIESQSLAVAVDSLVVAIGKERAATKVALDLRDVAIRDSRLENARLSAQNAALSKRPTRTQAGALAVVTAAAGFTYGVLR
jgi:hypothetical protein